MKKLLLFAAIAVATAVSFTSCEKKDGKEDEKQEEKFGFRIKTFADDWDTWTFSYDAEGRVNDVNRGEESKHWVFEYKDKTVTVTRQSDKVVAYAIELGDNGFCTKMTDEWGDVRTYEYDKSGRITKIYKGDELKSTIVIEDGCIKTWTRTQDGTLQTKTHVYTSQKNVGDIHNIYSEATDPSRWMYETGLFGHGPAYLCESNVWDYEGANKSMMSYEADPVSGAVAKETKTFENDDWVEHYFYTWEAIK